MPYYCVHCAVNELLPMEWGGHPLWVTDYDPDASKPCAWRFYKSAEAIPEKYYARAGRKKPKPGEVTVGDAIKVAIETQDLEILSVLIKAIEKKTGHGPAAIFQLANQVSGISKSEWERLLKKMNL